MNKKALQEKLARLSLDMHAIVNTAKADKDRGLTSEERTAFHAIETEYSGIESDIRIADKLVAIDADLRTVPTDRIAAEIGAPGAEAVSGKRTSSPLQVSAFGKYMRNGMEGLNSEERVCFGNSFLSNGSGIRNAQSTTTGSQGGFLVPTGFSNQLEQALKFFGGILDNVSEFETETGQALPWPTVNDTGNVGSIIGQNVAPPQVGFVLGEVTYNAYIFTSGLVPLPLALLQDSYFDLDAFAANLLGTRIARYANNQLTVGVGGGTGPTGLLTAAVAAGNTVQGAAGETTSLVYNDLVNLEHLVDPAYRHQGKFMFHDNSLKALKKLVDSSNRPLWQPALTASFGQGAQPMILDHPYVINNDMPVMAASAYPLIFGDLTKYKVRKVAGGTTLMRLVERYAEYLQVGFQAFMRMDGNLLDAGTHPVAVFQNSAA